jgi:hypothetical protein
MKDKKNQDFGLKTENRVGTNVSLTMNQDKLNRSDYRIHSFDLKPGSTVIEVKSAKIGSFA